MSVTQSWSASRLITELEKLANEHPDGILAFDGDGTLWSGDVGEDTFFYLMKNHNFSEATTNALRHECKKRNLDDSGEAAQLGKILFDAYSAGNLDEEHVCEIMAWVYAGFSSDELVDYAKNVLAAHSLATRVQEETSTVGEWASRHGIEIFIVSASATQIVRAAASFLSWQVTHVVAATPKENTDHSRQKSIIVEDVHRPIPYGPGKVHRLREKIGKRPILAAFGDNLFDAAMMREAKLGVAVRPKPRLKNILPELPNTVILEK